jgi:c-di-GMP-binding flagellar brake protein YcgR
MFFGRRKKGAPSSSGNEPAHREKRGSYRRPEAPRHHLDVNVHTASGESFPGELVDVSVGGAAARFTLAHDPGLARDEVVELCLAGPDRPSAVQTAARVIYVEQGGAQHWRYGFDFIDVGDLYSQLDEFYAQCFNRRRAERVEVPPEGRVLTRLEWSGGKVDCSVHDISTVGMGAWLAPDKASRLEGAVRLYARLRLPGVGSEIGGPVVLQHRTPVRSRMLIGFGFDLSAEGGFRDFERELSEYVQRRREEIDRWEAAIGTA